MGLFKIFKGSKTPPMLYQHGEVGSGNAYLSPLPSDTHPSIYQGNDPKTIKKRVKERVDAEILLERRQAEIETREKREERRSERRMNREAMFMEQMGVRGGSREESPGVRPFRRGDHGFVGITDDPRALGFMAMGRRGERRNPGWPDLRGMGRGDPAVPDHSFGRWDNGRGEGGRDRGGGRGPRGPAAGDKASAWSMHD
ncbi:hypothetical protein J4E91_004676 [Alternaria rosae]|nr:hypothetical protein J4E91_004676 [Alternaria rosae]